MNPSLPPDFSLQIEALLGLVGRQALLNLTPTAFTQWFKLAAPKAMPALFKHVSMSPEEQDRMLRFTALTLFAEIPLPDLAFQVSGQTKQGRNDPCACGSGQKYKHCCGDMDMPPLFTGMNLLRYVLDAYPKSRLGEVAQSRASVDAVADTARQWMEADELERVSALLSPYFSGTAALTARLSPLFNLLMDAWLQLGHNGKRDKLIDTLLQRGDRELKSDALQRRTTMLADRGDYAGAWSNFKQASATNPNDPALGFLEVTTLVSEGRISEAQNRAQWWVAFLSKQRDPQLVDLVEIMRNLAKDPLTGMMGVAAEANEDLQRLQSLFLAAPAPAVRHKFEVFMEENEHVAKHATTSELTPDAALSKLEKRWRDVFPQAKPNITMVHNGVEEVWDNATDWLDLLQQHPALWFSFDVLDDLVMAVDTVDWTGVQERLLVPMAERAAEQLRITLETQDQAVQCPWGCMAHRPVLRPIAHLAFICKEAGNWQRFMELAHWLVFELNPNDNHGLRDDLSCAFVRFERWADAIALYERYPDDMQPTLALNAVLASWRLGDAEETTKQLQQSAKNHDTTVKMLLATAPKPVKPDSDFGIRVGGKYQAWLYVSQMREFWERNQALEWARGALKPSTANVKKPPKGPQKLL